MKEAMGMKKVFGYILAALLLISTAAAAEQPSGKIGLDRGTELVIGSPTQMSGYFSTDLWGTNTADMDVRSLLHGLSTIAWTKEGIAPDSTVVRSMTAAENKDGTRTYTFTLYDGLMYSDGTAITARDYVFSLLLCCAPELGELGATPREMDFLKGYAEYRAGSPNLSGVRLLSDNTFSLTVNAEYQSYFYGIGYMGVIPYPISVIAPGCEVRDDGNGAYIAARKSGVSSSTANGYKPGEFSAEMLRVTMLDPSSGYVFNPSVTSGPYRLVSYDPNLREARLRVNEYYLGNHEGEKPHIESLVFRKIRADQVIQALESGEVGLVNKVSDKKTIDAAQKLAGTLSMQDYPRSGFAFIAFACEQEPTASAAVRRAIAYCIDKTTLMEQAVGAERGIAVHGYYGIGQWQMTASVKDAASGQSVSAVQAMEKYATQLDLDKARSLLESDGWTLNEKAEPYRAGVDAVRYKKQDGQLVPLMIRWAKTGESTVCNSVEESLKKPFEQLGIGFEVTTMPFSSVLKEYYAKSRGYNMFVMGSNFTRLFDPYYDYSTAPEHQGVVNHSGLKDERLMALARDLRRTDPSDTDSYMAKWMAFQARWVEQMPMAPLWSNMYADLYRVNLKGYDIAGHVSWAEAILYAYIEEGGR